MKEKDSNITECTTDEQKSLAAHSVESEEMLNDIINEENELEEYIGPEKKKVGRPRKGTTLRKAIRDHINETEAKQLVVIAKELAKTDKKILMFLLEQVFGKARQNVGIDGGSDGKPVSMALLLDQLEKPKKATKIGDNTFVI